MRRVSINGKNERTNIHSRNQDGADELRAAGVHVVIRESERQTDRNRTIST